MCGGRMGRREINVLTQYRLRFLEKKTVYLVYFIVLLWLQNDEGWYLSWNKNLDVLYDGKYRWGNCFAASLAKKIETIMSFFLLLSSPVRSSSLHLLKHHAKISSSCSKKMIDTTHLRKEEEQGKIPPVTCDKQFRKRKTFIFSHLFRWETGACPEKSGTVVVLQWDH